MEYLTLQDIPLRHHFARNMASSETHRGGDTGSLPGLAAVREHRAESSLPSLSDSLLPLPLPPPPPSSLFLQPRPMVETGQQSFSTSLQPTAPFSEPSAPLSKPVPPTSHHTPSATASIMGPASFPDSEPPSRRVDSKAGQESKVDTESQNHHLRNSPPFQPGEQRPSAPSLPSFSQLLQNVREPSPPTTPSRRTMETDTSPVLKAMHQPQFEDVTWKEHSKRRRVDYGDSEVSQRPTVSSDRNMYDARRPSAIDPALSSAYTSPRGQLPPATAPPTTDHHPRPSLPYPPHPSGPPAHARHQSSPHPQGHAAYQYQGNAAPPAVISGYPHPSMPAVLYDPRGPSYYEPHPNAQLAHSYGRPPHDPYYPREAYSAPPPPGYAQEMYHQPAQPYNSYTFQSTMGVDQNAFNRKRRGNLPKEATGILKSWFNSHRDSPYPTEDEKMALCAQTNLTINQVSNWFINARRRAPQKEQRDGTTDGSS